MGTTQTLTFEGTDGNAVTDFNGGLFGTGSFLYRTAAAAANIAGSTGGRSIAGASLTRFGLINFTVPHLTRRCGVLIRTPIVTPNVDVTMASFLNTGGSTVLRLMYTTGGAMAYQASAGGTINIATSIPLNTFYRWFVTHTINPAGGTTSTLLIKIFSATGPWTTQVGSTISSSAINMSTLATDRLNLGSLTGTTAGLQIDYDYCITEDNATAEYGAPPAATPPIADAGADQDKLIGDTVTLDGTASTAGTGTITSYAWTNTEFPTGASTPSLASSTTAQPTFVAAAGGYYKFDMTPTNSSGLTDSTPDSVTINVREQANTDTEVYSVTAPTYSNEGGAASAKAALNDANAATYILSADAPSGSTVTSVIQPIGLGALTIFIDEFYVTGPVNRTVSLRKMDGTTVIDSISSYAIPSASSTTRQWDVNTSSLNAACPTVAERRALVLVITDTQ